jgi:hypothetical protein
MRVATVMSDKTDRCLRVQRSVWSNGRLRNWFAVELQVCMLTSLLSDCQIEYPNERDKTKN